MASIIKGRLPIVYRVKQGCLNANNRPEKHDYLTVYRNTRSRTGYEIATDIMEKLGELYPTFNSVNEALVIPIRLVYDNPELNIKTHFACYDGRKVKSCKAFSKCKGDGKIANRLMQDGTIVEMNCPGPDKCPGMTYASGSGNIVKLCKLQGVFDFEIRGVSELSGGVARYRTAGFNSAANILGQLKHFRQILGILRGLPFNIELSKTTSQATDGNLFTFQSLMLSVAGEDPLLTLGEAKIKELENRTKYGIDMAALENYYLDGPSDELAFEEGEDDMEPATEELPESVIKAQADLVEKTNKAITIEEKQLAEESWKDSVKDAVANGEAIVLPKVNKSKPKVTKPSELPPDFSSIFPDVNKQ